MRNKLLKELELILVSSGVDTDLVKNKIVILLNDYEISERCTDLMHKCNEDSVSKFINLFLVNKRVAGRTSETLKNYRNVLRMFFDETNKTPLEIKADDIKLFLANKEIKDGISKTSQKNYLRVISSFYQWMCKEEYIIKNPLNKVDEIKIAKAKKYAFTEMEVEILRNEITNLRDKAILEVLLSTWCRISEVVGMNITDINGNKIEVLGKGEKRRIVYLNAKATIALNQYIASRTDENEALFVSTRKPNNRLHIEQMEKIIRTYGKSAGVDKCHPHRFRRTGATLALKKGMPIEKVSKLLGHESIETTQIYLDISDNDIEQAHMKYV